MTSLQSAPKQIPLNNGYFRVVPQLCYGTAPGSVAGTITPVSSYMFTFNSGVQATFIPPNANTQLLLSTGACLLKDMGVNYVFPGSNGVGTAAQYNTPIQFRRVQIVDPGTLTVSPPGATGLGTDGVNGSAAGLDSDYNVAYIQLGLKGNALPGPFIRTG